MSNTVAEKSARTASQFGLGSVGLYAVNGDRKYLNGSERQRVLAALSALEPRKALFGLTLAWTGARVSEILALTPASFQIERGVVAIVTLKRRRHVVRELPLPKQLTAALDQEFEIETAQRATETANRRIWTWHRVTAWRLIKEVARHADVAGRAACPRGLRHGFGVSTLQSGVPLNLVQRWLGHARMSTTAIYADATGPEELAFAARFWSQIDDDSDRF